MATSPPPINIAMKGNRVVAKFTGTASKLDKSVIDEFTKRYESIVNDRYARITSEPKTEKLLILFDLRNFTIDITDRKQLSAVKTITNFFISIRPMSEPSIQACAGVVQSRAVASVISKAMLIVPGEIKQLVTTDVDKAKAFLKSNK